MTSRSVKESVRSFVYAQPVIRDTWLNLQKAKRRLRYVANYGVWDWGFDRWHHLQTAGLEHPQTLTLAGTNGMAATPYLPVRPHIMLRALSDLHIDFARYWFVDMGSGKGRALFLAARYPFARVVGVEFAQELHRMAAANAAKFHEDHDRIELHWADVLDFPLPPEPLVLYLFHPFGAEMMARLLGQIAASIAAVPRDVLMIYVNPEHEAAITGAFPQAQLISQYRGNHRFVTYRLTAAMN